MPSGQLTGGIAFVTGGARGLGNAVAVSFAQEGAKGVVIVDIQDDEAMAKGKETVESHGAKCLAIRADVTKEAEMERAVAEAVAEFGRIDYAANFAGIGGPYSPLWDVPLDGYEKTMAVNSTGLLLSVKYEMKQMISQEPLVKEEGRTPQKGSIVNCASVNSIVATAGSVAYTVSKHAVAGITKAAALDGRRLGVRVNSVSPGFIKTQLVEIGLKQNVEMAGVWEQFESRQGRQGFPHEVGDAVALLSSPKMGLVVGHNLVIDGGFTINEMNV